MKYFPRIFILLPELIFTGCIAASSGPSLPAPTTSPETLPSTAAQHTGKVTSWRITPTSQPQTYSSLLTTVITQTDVPTVRRDSLITRALYSLSMIKNFDTVFFSGSITAFSIQGNTLESEETDPVTPIPFTGKLSNHSISTRAQNQDDCERSDQTALRVIQRNLFPLPVELAAGQSWTDSISSLVCNGRLPVTYTVIRTLTVLGESDINGNPVLVLDQSERTLSRGEGSQGQHRIIVEGQGLTSGRLYVDRISGQLFTANSINKTSVTIQSSGRIQHFLQNSTEVIQKAR